MNLKHEVMGLLKNFFTRKKEKNDTKQTQENYLPISNILEDLKHNSIKSTTISNVRKYDIRKKISRSY